MPLSSPRDMHGRAGCIKNSSEKLSAPSMMIIIPPRHEPGRCRNLISSIALPTIYMKEMNTIVVCPSWHPSPQFCHSTSMPMAESCPVKQKRDFQPLWLGLQATIRHFALSASPSTIIHLASMPTTDLWPVGRILPMANSRAAGRTRPTAVSRQARRRLNALIPPLVGNTAPIVPDGRSSPPFFSWPRRQRHVRSRLVERSRWRALMDAIRHLHLVGPALRDLSLGLDANIGLAADGTWLARPIQDLDSGNAPFLTSLDAIRPLVRRPPGANKRSIVDSQTDETWRTRMNIAPFATIPRSA